MTVDGRNPANQFIYIYIHVNFPLFTRFHTCQVVVSDCFHQQYKDFSKVAIFGES